MLPTIQTRTVRADNVQVGDNLLLDLTDLMGEPCFEVINVTNVRLLGDDVEMGNARCPDKVTTSRSNKVVILPRSIVIKDRF